MRPRLRTPHQRFTADNLYRRVKTLRLQPQARPGLDTPLAASLIEAVGQEPQPKYGWTDVARLSEIGIPAVNFGPGDALLAHTDNEHVSFSQLTRCHADLRAWLLSDRDED